MHHATCIYTNSMLLQVKLKTITIIIAIITITIIDLQRI